MRLSTFVKLAVVVLAVVCFIVTINNKIQSNALSSRKDDLEAQIAEDNEKIGELQNRLNAPFDREFVAARAKEKLNLVMPDEVIFYNDYSE